MKKHQAKMSDAKSDNKDNFTNSIIMIRRNKMFKRIFYYLLILAAVCFAVACKADLKKTIVGKWKKADSGETWEFKSDDSFKFMKSVGADSLTVSGIYTLYDDQTLELTAIHNVSNKPLEPIKGKVTINGDEMTFKDPEGTHILKRVSETSQEKSNTPKVKAVIFCATENIILKASIW